ncbi:helix-turn-helix transcriptional regulator [Haloprofundus salilacus]|uniref:helix-turn-helix transcriptional regulator n=1 Tax=Haloprofundus salilacus TaxID=2876190 RepID=UPI001CC99100|nr:MarR family winged helix-turn-helix transcriptional regulator [Haloprofundus salilacus]
MTTAPLADPGGFLELVRRAPMLEALRDGAADRRELEDELEISRATSHRLTRWFEDRGLVERVDSEFRLTETGRAVATALVSFKSEVTAALLLAPVLDAADDADDAVPPVPLSAFADATVTTPGRGDPHGPMNRYVSLVRETETLRGFDTWAIAPTYMGEIQERILDGMETTLVDPLAVVEDVMENYPERCVEVCVSGHLTIRLHDSLPFGLAVFDDRVGVAVRDPETNALTAFVDSDSSVAREWAEATYEAFESEAVLLENFTKNGVREALANQ